MVASASSFTLLSLHTACKQGPALATACNQHASAPCLHHATAVIAASTATNYMWSCHSLVVLCVHTQAVAVSLVLLQDMLAMRKTVGALTGRLLVNGRPASAEFTCRTSYVPQVKARFELYNIAAPATQAAA